MPHWLHFLWINKGQQAVLQVLIFHVTSGVSRTGTAKALPSSWAGFGPRLCRAGCPSKYQDCRQCPKKTDSIVLGKPLRPYRPRSWKGAEICPVAKSAKINP